MKLIEKVDPPKRYIGETHCIQLSDDEKAILKQLLPEKADIKYVHFTGTNGTLTATLEVI
jgi:hypothetical protein